MPRSVRLARASPSRTAASNPSDEAAVIFVTLGPFLARMNVRTQIAYTLLTVAVFNVLDLLVAHSGHMYRLSINLSLLTLGAIGTLAARQL